MIPGFCGGGGRSNARPWRSVRAIAGLTLVAAVIVIVLAFAARVVLGPNWRSKAAGRAPEGAHRALPEEGRWAVDIPQVRASDTGIVGRIIGQLGRPLGEIHTVQGEWQAKLVPPGYMIGKDEYELRFRVTTVNGKRLDKPVMFVEHNVSPIFTDARVEGLSPRGGDVWEFRCVETGRYEGFPPGVVQEIYPPGGLVPQITRQFAFYTALNYWGVTILRRGPIAAHEPASRASDQPPAAGLPKNAQDPFDPR
jgi:hypothetical protein